MKLYGERDNLCLISQVQTRYSHPAFQILHRAFKSLYFKKNEIMPNNAPNILKLPRYFQPAYGSY